MRSSLLVSLLAASTLPAPPARAQDDLLTREQRAMAEIGAAYVAKVFCSAIFLSGRTVEAIRADEFARETPLDQMLSPLFGVSVDREERSVTATIMGVQRKAILRGALGCVLVPGGADPAALRAQAEGLALPAVELDLTRPWPVGDRVPESVPADVDLELLDAAVAAAFAEPAEDYAIRTRAVLVVHRDRLIAERYAPGFGPTTRLAGWSMAKSVADALAGIRVGQGALALESPAGIEAWQKEGDPRAAIQVRHLLGMTPGLRWFERYDRVISHPVRMLFGSPDTAAFAAGQPLVHEPGTHWAYSSGCTNLLSRVLRATFDDDRAYWEFPRRELFDRIGMRSAVLEADASGTFVMSSFLYATARDWARFGLLYLHDGVWQGERILPEGWVRASITPNPVAPRGCYGRHWWLNAGPRGAPEQRPEPDLPADMFLARGFEGQEVVVIPSAELVVVRLGCTKVRGAWNHGELLRGVLRAVAH